MKTLAVKRVESKNAVYCEISIKCRFLFLIQNQLKMNSTIDFYSPWPFLWIYLKGTIYNSISTHLIFTPIFPTIHSITTLYILFYAPIWLNEYFFYSRFFDQILSQFITSSLVNAQKSTSIVLFYLFLSLGFVFFSYFNNFISLSKTTKATFSYVKIFFILPLFSWNYS